MKNNIRRISKKRTRINKVDKRLAAPVNIPELAELQSALDELSKMTNITTICSFCQKIRNKSGQWDDLAASDITPNTLLSHGFCPSCARKNFPDEYQAVLDKKPGIFVPPHITPIDS